MFNSSDIQNDHPTAAGYQTVQKVERTSESKSYPTEGNGCETARISNHWICNWLMYSERMQILSQKIRFEWICYKRQASGKNVLGKTLFHPMLHGRSRRRVQCDGGGWKGSCKRQCRAFRYRNDIIGMDNEEWEKTRWFDDIQSRRCWSRNTMGWLARSESDRWWLSSSLDREW